MMKFMNFDHTKKEKKVEVHGWYVDVKGNRIVDRSYHIIN